MPKASRSRKRPESAKKAALASSRTMVGDLDLEEEKTMPTPLPIRTTGPDVDSMLRAYVREQFNSVFAPYVALLDRTDIRFESESARRSAGKSVCRIRLELPALQTTVQTEASADSPKDAYEQAVKSAMRELRRVTRKPNARGRHTRARGEATSPKANLVPKDSSNTRVRQTKRRVLPMPEDGSLLGRRVGRATINMERAAERPEKRKRNATIDTALRDWSETDRRAGAASTAARNTKRNKEGMTSALEDSAKMRPSRVSTRRSANRSKRDANLRIRQTNRVHSPEGRASR